ncbi:MAG TPA: hypothetical protein VMV97_10535 [Sulfuriferula sp.]|nr:hypothetical protein [Sulfuriferula sp.]
MVRKTPTYEAAAMKTTLYIDSCAWNYLHDNNVDLSTELPTDQYAIRLTSEVEIEVSKIPDDKRSLKEYIQTSIHKNSITTTRVFGFLTLEPDGTPSKTQVYGGFNQGTFQSEEDRQYYASSDTKKYLIGKKPTNSGLGKNQADASLAVRATNSVIITNEEPNKSGPLRSAAQSGGKIVYLRAEVEPSGLPLGKYLASII